MEQDGPSLGTVISWISDAGTIGVLVTIVWGAIQEWWVTGRQYRRVVDERDYYRDYLLRVLGLTDRTTRALERVTRRVMEVDPIDAEGRVSRLTAEREIRQRDDEY